jgi:tetratricopeptide (TPR) repeat protein
MAVAELAVFAGSHPGSRHVSAAMWAHKPRRRPIAMSETTVRAWAERVSIPTYGVGEPDKNPMFLEKRVYQGSSGAVYPHPVIDRVSDEKANQEYTAVFLENRFLKIMLLPELGGRVQMALDKTNGYHFVYYNRVIKPALVGLAGPWISGGIEFNWPQHHRPSTFSPVDWRIEQHPDGSATVWCAENERMFRTRGVHGFRLHPERAVLEIDVRLANRSDLPQTFLWWANPAVHVNDDYQSVFPPDVRAVMDHGKRDVSSFPIATGTYYKVDYSPGTDISRYKNIPVPTSYMAAHSDFDFLGCYDHGAQAGMLHVANHHLVPGKKQWTWGHGDFGRAWDRQLTDEDGPYIELMCGAFTDNQPDFSWLMPGEEKRFTQTFMPYKLIGPPVNASTEAAISLALEGGAARLGVYVTSPRTVRVTLARGDETLYQREVALSPEGALLDRVALPAGARPEELTLAVSDAGRELLAFTPLAEGEAAIPAAAQPARPPAEIGSNEELYLNGLHLEQYRHATYRPEPYYEEALRRDPGDSRCNNALGLLLLRRGRFAEAEPFFRAALARLTARNPNPYDGEPAYNLGLALAMQGRDHEATDALYKATWNAAWQDAACFALARLASRGGRPDEALELTERALRRNGSHHRARHLRIALLRRQGRPDEARREATLALELDPLESGALWELRLLNGDGRFAEHHRGDNTHAELGLDYAHAGLYAEAVELFRAAPGADPMRGYFAGWCLLQAGDTDGARAAFEAARALSPDYCFPNKLENVPALQAAMALCPDDPRAPYYLGLFWYAQRRHEEAIACWERARAADENFPTVHRNLALAYYNQRGDGSAALASLERAFALNPADARVLFELDQLRKKLNHQPAERLAALEQHGELVAQRDDLSVERITLLNLLGRPDEAFELISARTFHPWEGGEGKVTGQYVLSLVELARRAIGRGEGEAAIRMLGQAQAYPHNLGEGKLPGAQENQIFYELGRAERSLGNTARAQEAFERAATGLSEPTSALYYNDQPPDMIFYQGLARRALGREQEAREIFTRLVAYGERHLDDEAPMDYFAVSLPDFLVFEEDMGRRNRIHCHYMIALGATGLAEYGRAAAHYATALELDASHLGATVHRRLLQREATPQ